MAVPPVGAGNIIRVMEMGTHPHANRLFANIRMQSAQNVALTGLIRYRGYIRTRFCLIVHFRKCESRILQCTR
jgi:hypothetical protein